MRTSIRRFASRLAACPSGNATLLVALGMPMLIGGAGLSVDTAQWYLWQRELQFAVDQAAVAGAWAKAADENGTTYIAQAQQQYAANASLIADFDTTPTVSLANYDGGVANSVLVTGSATKALPFSSLLTRSTMTVAVRAQAIYEPGETYRPCLLALDRTAANALLFRGAVNVTATCGASALSNHKNAVAKDGSTGRIDVGFVMTAGGIYDQHGLFKEEERFVGATDLIDPYEGLQPPNNSTPRSLTCPSKSSNYTADETVRIRFEYAYFRGRNKDSLTPYTHPNPKPTTTSPGTTTIGKSFSSAPQSSETIGSPTLTQVSGGGNDTVWERETRTAIRTYANIVAPSSAGPAVAQPGTYTSFTINCDTILSSGVYVLSGTRLLLEGLHKLSGTGVMIVLKNGAGVRIAGGAEIDLTAMSRNQLIAAGVPSADADRMRGMLIFEDPNSPGATSNEFTGTSTQILNGVIYMPKSSLKIAGTPEGTSQCTVLATKMLELAGSVDLTSMCPGSVTPNAAISETKNYVRLVG